MQVLWLVSEPKTTFCWSRKALTACRKCDGLTLMFLLLVVTEAVHALFFLKEPIDTITAEGMSFNITCEARHSTSSPEAIKYMWLRNNAVVTSPNVAFAADGTLTVFNAKKVDNSGVYVCIASVQETSITSQRATVTFADIQLPFIKSPSRLEGIVGHKVTFHCSIKSVPLATYRWQLNQKIDTNRCLLIQHDEQSSCIIESVSYDDAGQIGCSATNAFLNKTVMSNTGYLTVSGPPVFRLIPKGETVREGSSSQMHCHTFSRPEATMSWSLPSGRTINSSGETNYIGKYTLFQNGSLLIWTVEKKDSGVYTCKVSNAFGTVKAQAILTVADQLAAPVITSASKNITTIHGNSGILLSCSASGNPQPAIIWEKVGGYLNPSRLSYPAPELLRISPIDRSDHGMYKCTAKNSIGISSREIFLGVKAPPLVSTPLGNQIVSILNTSITISCSVDAYPRPSVSWLLPKNVSKVPETTVISTTMARYEVTINPITLNDEGEYKCIATNEIGSGSTNMFMQVYGPPRLSSMNVQRVYPITMGQKWSLKCPLIGPPAVKYLWTLREKVISNRQIIGSERALEVDKGSYICQAENYYGRKEITIRVFIATPPKALVTTNNLDIIEGRSLDIKCNGSGVPAPEVAWFYGSKVLNGASITSATLAIPNITRRHQGYYHCLAKNTAGNSSALFFLNVLVKPHTLQTSSNISVTEGESASLECIARGNEPPVISWFHVMENGTTVDVCKANNRCRLVQLKSIKFYHMGWYICKASNLAGTLTTKVFLSVQFKPVFLVRRRTIREMLGNYAVLHCIVRANPPPVVHWVTPYGEWLSVPSLHFLHAMKNQTGVYTCVAENSLGVSSQLIEFIVECKPSIVKLSYNIVNLTTVKLGCFASGRPYPEITWKRPSRNPEKDNVGEISQTGTFLSLQRTYLLNKTIICFAKNKHGVDEVHIRVPQTPANVSILKGMIPDIANAQWILRRYHSLLPLNGIQIQYREVGSSIWSLIDLKGNRLEVNLTNLAPFTSYEIKVAAKNVIGWSSFSDAVYFKTDAKEPSKVTDLEVRHLNYSTVNLIWKMPFFLNGPLQDILYHVSLKKVQGNFTRRSIQAQNNQVLLRNLDFATNYNATVTAGRMVRGHQRWGPAAWIEFLTSSPVPTVVPEQIQVTTKSHNQIVIRWKMHKKPDYVSGYIIFYRRYGLDVRFQSTTAQDNTAESHKINDLSPDTTYEIRMVAISSGGYGPYSKTVYAKTGVDKSQNESTKMNSLIWVSIGTLSVITVLLLIVVLVLIYKRRSPVRQGLSHPDEYCRQPNIKNRHFTLRFGDKGKGTYQDSVQIKQVNSQDTLNSDLSYSTSPTLEREVENPIFLVEARADAIVIGNNYRHEATLYGLRQEESSKLPEQVCRMWPPGNTRDIDGNFLGTETADLY